MQKTLLYKILIVVGLIVLICVPLTMIEAMIRARSATRAEAVAGIAASSVREQTIVGPVLVVQYLEEYEQKTEAVDPANNGDRVERVVAARSVRRNHLVFPNELTVNGKINTFNRKRGIFNVMYYKGVHEMDGEFTLPDAASLPHTAPGSRITVTGTRVAIGIDDVRGVQNTPTLVLNDARIGFRQGTGLNSLPGGLHADLGVNALATPGKPVRFHLTLALDGTEQQRIVPVANNTRLTIASNWPHPSFGGQFLPAPDDAPLATPGFRRTWNIANVSNNSQMQMAALEHASEQPNRAAGPASQIDAVGIDFIEPVDVYTMSERTTKYGLLFVALTFAAFFMFEILKSLPIHPIQYLLVGLALALFFLLLIALSEHIPFWQAYVAASAACIVLICYYVAAVLRDWRRGAGFGCGLTALYGALYGLLISENNSLVLGSLLLFAILGGVMVATRHVDWYRVGKAA